MTYLLKRICLALLLSSAIIGGLTLPLPARLPMQTVCAASSGSLGSDIR